MVSYFPPMDVDESVVDVAPGKINIPIAMTGACLKLASHAKGAVVVAAVDVAVETRGDPCW